MLTGWQKIEGEYFYLNTAADGIEGLMRTAGIRMQMEDGIS